MIKLSDYVIARIAKAGVKHVFTLTGGGSMHLNDSLGRSQDLEYVCCLHEQACALAAEAYGEHSGLGAALVTTGPGSTNAITGVATAWVEGSGCIFISGQAKRVDTIQNRDVRSMGQQEINIIPVVESITKYAFSVTDPYSIRYHLEKAIYLATAGRPGPVWIEIPLDVQSAMIDESRLLGYEPLEDPGHLRPSLIAAVDQAIALIQASRRPVFYLGNGVRHAGAIHELRALLDELRIPVLLTWKAADILSEDHPLYRGRPGGIGQRAANFTQQKSDCIIIIGARLDLPSIAFDHQNFAPVARKIMVDIDGPEILKMQTRIDVPVHGDAGAFIRALRQKIPATLRNYDCTPWLETTRAWYVRFPTVLDEYRRDDHELVSTYYLMEVLSEYLTPDDVIVPGSAGACSDILMQAFKIKTGQRVLNAPGLGVMGSGIPATIGACLASGRKRTISPDGDGGFIMNIQDLETVRRLNLPIKYFVLNNDGYSSIYSSQRVHFQGRLMGANPESGVTLPDFRKVATAFGIKSVLIDKNVDMPRVVHEVLAYDGPVICEVMVSPKEKTIPRVTAFTKPDGTIASNPMEDMSPPLPREEFAAIMAE
jgi:acetolactate synthase-1/2/3 large subunit